MSREMVVRVETMPDMKAEIHRLKYGIQLIQQAIKEVMVQDVHYGIIPGTKKPTLYKAGAEKICTLFKLRAKPHYIEVDLGGNHKQFTFTIEFTDAKGNYIGQGVGSCSTLESKYRWRKGEGTSTGKPLPKEYWELKKSQDPRKNAQALEMLGGKGFFAKKDDTGAWMIFQGSSGDRVENPDIADCWNTAFKIAKKRALVDGTLTCTAASDCFDQDLDDEFEQGETFDAEPEQREESPVRFLYDIYKLPEEKREAARMVAVAGGARESMEQQGLFEAPSRIAKLDNAKV